MKKKVCISPVYPKLIDKNIYNNTIIERVNITSYDDNGKTAYYYDQYEYSLEEYFENKISKIGADLDYISMMTEVDL